MRAVDLVNDGESAISPMFPDDADGEVILDRPKSAGALLHKNADSQCITLDVVRCRREVADVEAPLLEGSGWSGALVTATENSGKATIKVRDCDCNTFHDAELMTHVAVGDEDAILVLFNRYSARVRKIALAILKDKGEAQDIVQQIFLDLYQKAGRFDSAKGTFSAWLSRMASHAARNRKDYLRARQFYKALPLDETVMELPKRTLWSIRLAAQEQEQLLNELLAKLTPAQRLAIELKFFEGLTANQVATVTGRSSSWFENNAYRALKKLRALIRQK